MNSRRRFLASGAAFLIAPSGAYAQQPRAPRVGMLIPSTAGATANLTAAFLQGLREHGYRPGENVALDVRYSDGHDERIGTLAAALAGVEAAVIVTTTDAVARRVRESAPRTPIVMVNGSDPVAEGLAATLARPGGNVTGLTNFSPEVNAKRLQLLKEAIPALSRVAYLWNPDLPGAAQEFRTLQAAAVRLGIAIHSAEVRREPDLESVFASLGRTGAAAILVQAPNPALYTGRKRICELANAGRLASMFNREEYVAAGGLMSYGPDVPDMYRRAADYVDRILKGAKPGELPMEQPSRFELVLNRGTATALGLAVSPSVLARVDRYIQ